jgi:hypothetical protein
MRVHADIQDRRPYAGIVAEMGLLSASVVLAIGGIGIVSAAVRRQRPADERPEPSSEPSGDPELPDEPMGVPAEESSDNGDIELPGFPRNDPTHG